jgi:hypothetical protein
LWDPPWRTNNAQWFVSGHEFICAEKALIAGFQAPAGIGCYRKLQDSTYFKRAFKAADSISRRFF